MRQRLEGRWIWARAGGCTAGAAAAATAARAAASPRRPVSACRCLPLPPCSVLCGGLAPTLAGCRSAQCACGAARAAGGRAGWTDRRVDLRRGLVVEPVATTGGTAMHSTPAGCPRPPSVSPRGRAGRLQLAARLGPDRSSQLSERSLPHCAEAAGCNPDGPVEVLAERVGAVVSVVHAVGVEHRDDLQSRLVSRGTAPRCKSREHKE